MYILSWQVQQNEDLVVSCLVLPLIIPPFLSDSPLSAYGGAGPRTTTHDLPLRRVYSPSYHTASILTRPEYTTGSF